MVIITPKFDGLSLCVDERNECAITRGDGEYGQRSDEHYKFIQNKLDYDRLHFAYTYGEVMMPKTVFIDKGTWKQIAEKILHGPEKKLVSQQGECNQRCFAELPVKQVKK